MIVTARFTAIFGKVPLATLPAPICANLCDPGSLPRPAARSSRSGDTHDSHDVAIRNRQAELLGAAERARKYPRSSNAFSRSQCFEQAGRSQEFLRFVVEQTLAGAADRLKGYTIAIEVFRRPADFDAQSDPLVRVEAGRLRRRLLEYYVAEGYANPLRIELPRGGYAPEFRYSESTPREPIAASALPSPHAATLVLGAADAEPTQPPRRSRRRKLRAVAALATIVVLAGLLIVQRLDPTSGAGAELTRAARSRCRAARRFSCCRSRISAATRASTT